MTAPADPLGSQLPPPPPPPPHALAAMFAVREVKGRGPFALRAALAVGTPVLVGWALDETALGFMATIGAFTSLYGSGRPYVHRARLLGAVAAALSLSVGMGIWAAAVPWLGVLAVVVIAMSATLVCNALEVGPPGAYIVGLACAAGTQLHTDHVGPVPAALLVLTGGLWSWVLHMSVGLVNPRGPEKAAVTSAGLAVAAFLRSVTTSGEHLARQQAAAALHSTWACLITQQPVTPSRDGTLSRLRALNRRLHLLFAQGLEAAAAHQPVAPDMVAECLDLVSQVRRPPSDALVSSALPLGPPGAWTRLRDAVRPGSTQLVVVARVGLAVGLTGALAAEVGLERAYWAMAAALLVLHQGFDRARTFQKGLERMVGTVVGLGVAYLVFIIHPQGLVLVAVVMVLQFLAEMTVVRNYAIAVLFITSLALTMATGGQRVDQIAELLSARGEDTILGCVVGLAVYAATARWGAAERLPDAVTELIDSVRSVVPHIAAGLPATAGARRARVELIRRTLSLAQAYDAAVAASTREREAAASLWPTVVATQRVAYQTIATCWALERLANRDAARATADALLGHDGAGWVDAALRDLSEPTAAGPRPVQGEPPLFLREEIAALRESLASGRPPDQAGRGAS